MESALQAQHERSLSQIDKNSLRRGQGLFYRKTFNTSLKSTFDRDEHVDEHLHPPLHLC